MKMTVMLDLDDTLLGGVAEHFMPAYLDALGQFFSPDDPNRSIRKVINAIMAMVDNQDPAKSLEQVFDETFYPSMGLVKSEIIDKIYEFYETVHATLQPTTHVIPGAHEFIAALRERGRDIVIATNPLFPRIATSQRLAWAGFPIDRSGFKLVSTYEGFHFAKPNPAYYQEILAQTGCAEQPVVMMGDSLSNDGEPMLQLDIPFFHFNPGAAGTNHTGQFPAGGYDAALAWIDEQAEHDILPASIRTANIAALYATPAALATTLKPLTQAECDARPEPEEWSISEIIHHLTEADSGLNIPRIRQILANKNPFITDLHNGLNGQEHNPGIRYSLEKFIAGRKQLLTVLSSLQDDDWSRPARHSIFGPVDIAQMVDFIATHDRVHIRQIHKTLALIINC